MNINNRILFVSGKCEPQKISKIKVLAGRGGAYKCSKIRIDVLNQNIKPVNILLRKISSIMGSEFDSELETNSEICTSFFNELRNFGIKCFGSIEKHAMIFEFYNPFKESVRVYITMLGDAATTEMIGKE